MSSGVEQLEERVLLAFDTPILNFDAQGFNGVNPPDTVGDVGVDHYIQMVNGPGGAEFTIYNKADGSIALGPLVLDTLAPPGPGTAGRGDPIVLYDQLADRWLLTEFSAATNGLSVFISQTNDPTDNLWYHYFFNTPDFPDYPKFAVWPDGYFVSTNESVPAVYAMDRTNMLLGLPAAPIQRFTAPPLAGFGFQALIPSDHDGAAAPPGGSPNYFMRHRDDEVHNVGLNDPTQDFLEIWEFQVDFATPANSTFAQTANIPIAEIDSDLCGLFSFNCFPQPGSAVTLDPLREVIMHRLQYRNFGTHETLVGNLVTDVDGTDHGGVRWFELRKVGAGPWTLFQEGTHAPDAAHRWMGGISMDGNGNIALGYNVSDAFSIFPGIRYAGRRATDPLGTLPEGEHILVDGTGANLSNRWGDYSAMSVDPVNDTTFWFTGMYATASGRWQTRIGSFEFAPLITEPPQVDDQSFVIPETSPNGTVVGTVVATDPDVGDTLTYAIIGGNTGNTFALDPNTGQLTVNDNSSFATNQQFLLTVEVTDSIGLTDSATVVVVLQDTSAPSTVNSIFLAPLRQLLVQANDGESIFVTVAGTDVLVNGGPPSTGVLDVTQVGSIRVEGGQGANLIDLSQVTTANGFAAGTGITVTGSDGPDTIFVSPLGGLYFGNHGDDLILGDVGDDTIDGGDGADTIIGNAGADSLLGGDGDDVITGDDGDDTIDAGHGSDTVSGDAGNDNIRGNDGDDTLNGNDGDDTLNGGAGVDLIHGDDGNDQVLGGGDGDVLFGDDGNDTLRGQGGDDTLDGGAGDDLLQGNAGADSIFGGADNDMLRGQGGNDTLAGGLGNDNINGNSGEDSLNGGEGNDQIRGGAGRDSLVGEAGDDTVRGQGHDDTLNGGSGTDRLDGGVGDDYIESGPEINIADAPFVVEGDVGTVDAAFTVTLSRTSRIPVTVNYVTVDGTATAGLDFQFRTGTITFDPGETLQTIVIPVIGDILDEFDENFFVNLFAPSAGIINDDQGEGTIIDDDPLATISIDDIPIDPEGDIGETTDAVFTVSLSAPSGKPISVTASATAFGGGSATASVDYQPVVVPLSFPPGTTTRTVTVPVFGDDLNESNENFFVRLSAPVNSLIADQEGEGTIMDDDGTAISINDVTGTEPAAPINGTTDYVFTVTLSTPSTSTISVDYMTSQRLGIDAATENADYLAQSGTVTFNPLETVKTITVPVVQDRVVEQAELFDVLLIGPPVVVPPAGSPVVIADNQGVGTIIDLSPFFFITAGGTSGPVPGGNGVVQRLNFDGTGLTTLVNLGSSSRPRGITVDDVNGRLYWNDWETELTQSSNFDGSGLSTVVDHNQKGINAIDVDPEAGRFYVAFGLSGVFEGVRSFDLDGSNPATIWDLADTLPGQQIGDRSDFIDGVAIDRVNDHVYLGSIGLGSIDGGPHGIIRVDLDGSNGVSLVPHLTGRGRGVAVDPAGGKMYFAEHGPRGSIGGQIWRANLDGSNLEVIVTGLSRPRDVTLDLEVQKVYWVDEATGLLQESNLDGSGLATIASGLDTPDSVTFAFVTLPGSFAPSSAALVAAGDHLVAHAADFGLTPADFSAFEVTNQYTTTHTGVTHIHLRQEIAGLDVADAVANVNIGPDGTVLSAHSSFFSSRPANVRASDVAFPTTAPESIEPVLPASEALVALAGNFGWTLADTTPDVVVHAEEGDVEQKQTLAASGVSFEDIPASLQWVAVDGVLELGWKLNVQTVDGRHWYDVTVSAEDGEVLRTIDWVADASYNVLHYNLDSPDDGPRTIEIDPQETVASPFGWHDVDGIAGAEFTDTRGNNVFAQEDRDADNAGGFRPDGGAALDFDFPIDFAMAPITYEEAAITNLFYMNNILHDIHYQYGFDEVSGNFQENNYGRGGIGGDHVFADAQDGSGVNNANFATPPDGFNPRMQQFIFTFTTPNRDSDLANDVIIHEYGHGVSNRLTGGPANSGALSALESRGMGEGWSDFWALMFNQKSTDGQFDAYPVGTYVLGQPPNGPGIRNFPYSFDLGINPQTYADIATTNWPHGVGEIWNSALWDLNWLLINGDGNPADIHGNVMTPQGFDSDLYFGTDGNNVLLQLVNDGLKLQPANPSMLDGRDAILMADQILTGGQNQWAIWTAFARRGMGFSAVDNGANSLNVTEAFDRPPQSGVVLLDQSSYFVGDTVTIQVGDRDLEGAGTLMVDVTTSGGDMETVTLTELSLGLFEGTIDTQPGSVILGNGFLDIVGDQELMTVSYFDPADMTNNPIVVEALADIIALSEDTLLGGDGNDTLIGGAKDEFLFGGSGDDTLDGGGGNDLLLGGGGNDTLTGNAGSDTLDGQGAADVVFGDFDRSDPAYDPLVHVGNDVILWNGAQGNDTIDGGLGFDQLQVSTDSANDRVTISAQTTRLLVNAATPLDTTGDTSNSTHIESVAINTAGGNDRVTIEDLATLSLLQLVQVNTANGGDLVDASAQKGHQRLLLNGSNGADTLIGGSGDDFINGEGGPDVLTGGGGDDFLNGGDAPDTLSGSDGDDVLVAEAGRDLLFGDAGHDTLDGGQDNDTLDGGSGDDSLLGGFGDDTILAQAGNDTLEGSAGDDTLDGGSGNDSLLGDAGVDSLRGNDGDDTLAGGDDGDTLIGGFGNDLLNGNDENDFLNGNAGRDTLVGDNGDDTLLGGAGSDVLLGLNGRDHLNGNGGADSLLGGDNGDVLRGGTDDDTLNGGDGNDLLIGEAGKDALSGHDGDDTLNGGGGQDTLVAGNGDDTLRGGADGDYLLGNQGADNLDGQGATDTLSGGQGQDTLTGVPADVVDESLESIFDPSLPEFDWINAV